MPGTLFSIAAALALFIGGAGRFAVDSVIARRRMAS
jgi:hypothetical protein